MIFSKLKHQLTLLFWLTYFSGFSQITHPKASPFSKVEQEVGLSKFTVEYSRPAVRGRRVFENHPDGQAGLVPNGRIWRVGANEATKFTVDTNVEVLGNVLSKGTYSIYAFPHKDEWEIVFHTNTSHWGDGRKKYNPEEDAFRIKIAPQSSKVFQENFLITFDSITHNSAHMIWLWENTKISIPFITDTDRLMELEIAKQLDANPTAQTYYEAARYYEEQKKKFPTALKYLNKAIELGGDTYYFHRVKSLVEAALDDYPSAIKSAEMSMKLAQKEAKDEFVRMNKKNIQKWQALVKGTN